MRVYDVIKTAEDTYISETSRLIYPGMCWCLKVSAVKGFDFKEKNRKGHPSYKDSDTTFVGREAIILGYAYRKDGEWKFKALGNTGSWQSIGEIERALPNFI